MARGKIAKPIEEHIAAGTFRADRHGLKDELEAEILRKMKYELWAMFKKIKKELSNTDITKDAEKYKNLHGLMLEQVKTFNSLVKNPLGKEQVKKEETKIDEFAP
jgi:hypothetical protein